MSDAMPINGEVLKWARESAGLTIDEVVQKMKRKRITYELVESWEQSAETPTYSQLERLAYEVYKRPLAIFFFPEPPAEVTAKQSFRTLPEYEIQRMPIKMRFLLRKAQSFQLNLYDLYDGVNPSDKKITRNLEFPPNISAKEMGVKVREYLGISIDTQTSFNTSENAFKEWRKILENFGLFIFKDAFQSDEFSGFCLYDEKFPVIYVNNSKPFTRQVFTIFHELAHLLFKTGGIDTNIDDYLDYLDGDEERIEILCNSFAGEFLVPSEHFYEKSKNISVNDENIGFLANIYHVSREVILRKFYDSGKIDKHFYSEKVQEWRRRENNNPNAGSGGNYYFTKGAYLGGKYIEKAFSQFYQNRITTEILADYLGVKVKNISGMESLLYRMESST
ncbi:MAG: ImmA/IrrE family metallo-endopeptidase [Gammaproteobacteria bacterium]|nr:ImmA/IrrE family metallo-endopeptidase [Gammaproteobacteria bacterium]